MFSKAMFPTAEADALSLAMKYTEEKLSEIIKDRKFAMRVLLAAEEAAALFIEKAKPDASLKVEIRHGLAGRELVISVPGEQADPFPDSGMEADFSSMEDEDARQAIRAILLKAQEERIHYSYARGVNRIRISLALTKRSALYYTVAALAAGLLFGLILKLGMPGIAAGIDTYLLNPFTTVFMNALKMIIGPVVFFSIVSCITQFKKLSELGRIGAKIMEMYMLTTVIAVVMALGISAVIKPGEWGFARRWRLRKRFLSIRIWTPPC